MTSKKKVEEPVPPRLTEQVLRDQLIAKEVESRTLQNSLAEANMDFLLHNINEILALVPNHECTSCTDTSASNDYSHQDGTPRCTRCRLLSIKKHGVNDGTVLNISLEDWEPWETDPSKLSVVVSEKE